MSHSREDCVTADERILSAEASEALFQRLQKFARGGGKTLAMITSWWQQELRWGRDQVTLSSDRRDVRLIVKRQIWGMEGKVTTNQIDDDSLEAAVRAAESDAIRGEAGRLRVAPTPPFDAPLPALPVPKTAIWSDATYKATPETMARVARDLTTAVKQQQLMSAGYVEARAGSRYYQVGGSSRYDRFTQAQCSLTVRDQAGTGSGWAGETSYDWAALDPAAYAKRAMEKCQASRNPVALEPGRYTVILEPQAVADLMESMLRLFNRPSNEYDKWRPFYYGSHPQLGIGLSKLGLKVADERITLQHDPVDPLLGITPEPGMGAVTYIDRGVLTHLDYDRVYSVNIMGQNNFIQSPQWSYRLTGSETTSLEQMIATTQRGVLVTRLSGTSPDNSPEGSRTAMTMGMTRDGLWLIENGKISKAVKNFRFVDSPLFVLNKLEQIGEPVPVFRPVRDPDAFGLPLALDGGDVDPYHGRINGSALTPALVPALKARDFAFTALIDAT